MFNWLFGNNKKETLSESIVGSLCDDLTKLAEGAVPDIKDQVEKYLLDSKKGFIDGLKDILEETKEDFGDEQSKVVKEQTKVLLTALKNKFIGFLDMKGCVADPQFLRDINSTVECQQKLIALSCDITKDYMTNYQQKIERANTYLKLLVRDNKKVIKILIIGPTQKGKTSLACLISKISKGEFDVARINSFGKSDTIGIKEYKLSRNGVELIWIDTPGWWDSRGEDQDRANKALIEQYIEKNKNIDVIMFVAKLGDTLDANIQKSIADFGQKCGSTIWSKSLLVLTWAHSVASPSEYMEIALKELFPNEGEEIFSDPSKLAKVRLLAWKKFTRASSETWQQYFSNAMNASSSTGSTSSTSSTSSTCSTGSTSSTSSSSSSSSSNSTQTKPCIPVCLVETSLYELPVEKKVPQYLLYDGTPFLEELMCQIMLLVDKDKTPIAFLAMATDVSSSSSSSSSSKNSQHERSLNNAAEKVMEKSKENSKEEGSWCLLL